MMLSIVVVCVRQRSKHWMSVFFYSVSSGTYGSSLQSYIHDGLQNRMLFHFLDALLMMWEVISQRVHSIYGFLSTEVRKL